MGALEGHCPSRSEVTRSAIGGPFSAHAFLYFNYLTGYTATTPCNTMASATRGSKRQRTADDTDKYELIYWPTIPGRGEHIRLFFEATGTPYVDVCNTTDNGTKELISLIKPDSSAPASDAHHPPPLAPPLLRHGDLLLSQTPVILAYLASRIGLKAGDDPHGLFHVQSLALTALDGLSNEAHDTHHPIGTALYYEDQKPEALRKAKDYRETRLPKFLAHFERSLNAPSSGGGEWLYGGELTYADLVLFQCLDGVTFSFPKAIQRVREIGEYEKVFALYERVKALPKIKEYLGSDRRQKYGNGIYRHYPELDDE